MKIYFTHRATQDVIAIFAGVNLNKMEFRYFVTESLSI